ncbi:aminotransferase class IV [Hydrogenophaga atypica]|uniref:Aminotransferase class IV n=1 Tax=Hydrogenophaga atypica TaxID=249409 RepID=A0ABW2QTN4_9BURK
MATRPAVGYDSDFFRHKTTRRAHYDAFAPTTPGVFDTLLWNEQDQLTEFTRGNVALKVAGEWLTPPLSCGLLPGARRGQLLEEGRLREAVLTTEDLDHAQAIAFFNSLCGWLNAKLI